MFSPNINTVCRYLPIALVILLVTYIWIGSPFPFQDYPQHLAIAKVIRDYDKIPLYQEYYELNGEFVNYHILHHFLAYIGRYVDLELAFKILLTIYTLVFFVSFRHLISVQFPNEKTENQVRLCFFSTVFFSPPLMMGFIPYILGIPFLVACIALTYSLPKGRFLIREKSHLIKMAIIFACILACGIFHGFSLLTLIAVAFCYYVTTKRPIFLSISGLSLLYFFTLSTFMGLSLNKKSIWDLEPGYKFNYPGLQVIQELLGMRWHGSLASINNVLWSFFESHPWQILLPLVTLSTLALYYLNRLASSKSKQQGLNASFRAGIALIIIGFFCPWAIGWPTDFTFIDVRLFATAAILIYASFPAYLIKSEVQKKILLSIILLNSLLSYYGKGRYKLEADAALAVIDRIPPEKVLISVITDHYSSHIAGYAGVNHFLPMFYTLRNKGINTQFWAGLTAHIPIKYAKNKKFSIPDWRTWQLKKSHLMSGDYLLANQPAKENKVTKEIKATYMPVAEKQTCIKQWCLYKLDSEEILEDIF